MDSSFETKVKQQVQHGFLMTRRRAQASFQAFSCNGLGSQLQPKNCHNVFMLVAVLHACPTSTFLLGKIFLPPPPIYWRLLRGEHTFSKALCLMEGCGVN